MPAFTYCLVSDANVFSIFGDLFVSTFKETGKTLYVKVVPPGETTKSRKMKEEIEDFMLQVPAFRRHCYSVHLPERSADRF